MLRTALTSLRTTGVGSHLFQRRGFAIALDRNLKVRDLLDGQEKPCGTIDARAPIGDAVAQMVAEKQGALMVLDGPQVYGMLTDRDVMNEMADPSSDFASLSVGEVASATNVTSARAVTPVFSVRQTVSLMVENFPQWRHVPVFDSKQAKAKYLGAVSILDIVQNGLASGDDVIGVDSENATVNQALALRRRRRRMGFVNVSSADSAREAAQAMVKARCGCAFVTDDSGNLAGVFTDRDFLHKCAIEGDADVAVSTVMNTSDLALVTPETSMQQCYEEMANALASGKRRVHYPVVGGAEDSDLRASFDRLDTNKDGLVSSTELKEAGEQLQWRNDDVVGVILLDDIVRFIHGHTL